jgi:predicted house-cleaning noncanonical NTP pyrophosphatase (MazG superfamily)
MRKIIQRLVRDGIQQRIAKEGGTCEAYQMDAAQFKAALREKLKEELDEVLAATHTSDILAELADLGEVLAAYAGINGISEQQVRTARASKRALKGGFYDRWMLVSVILPGDELTPEQVEHLRDRTKP